MNHMLSIFRKYRESRMQNPSLLEVMLLAHPILCKYSESRVETEKSRSIFVSLPFDILHYWPFAASKP